MLLADFKRCRSCIDRRVDILVLVVVLSNEKDTESSSGDRCLLLFAESVNRLFREERMRNRSLA